MRVNDSGIFHRIRFAVNRSFHRHVKLCFVLLPVVLLIIHEVLGETGLIVSTILVPVVYLLFLNSAPGFAEVARDRTTGLVLKGGFLQALNDWIVKAPEGGRSTACLVLELDDFGGLRSRFGDEVANDALRQVSARMQSVLRGTDVLARQGNGGFLLGLSPVRRIDLESMIQLSARLHEAVEEPFVLNGATIHLTACSAFCLQSRSPAPSAEAMMEAAGVALAYAQQQGAGSIRAYAADMQTESLPDPELRRQLEHALSNGEIRPWYQPQVSTNTGKITGVEALARWIHPEQGLIPPSDFLPIVEATGLSTRLGEVILFHALTALKSLEKSGTFIPVMGVNFSDKELRDPRLVDRIRWELDRFDLDPQRLGVEILENVIADHENDIISRNIRGLSELGCYIDLDDFGTGHASISSIRRFAIGRLKVDRSFVTKVDTDQQQQRMISAILTMAEQLQLETLAEGVETPGEHAMLAQLGCGHVQGFGVARPMPLEDLPAWVDAHEAEMDAALRIGRGIG